MKTITVNFEQCYLRYHILNILRKYFKVEYSKTPNFLFYGWRNNEFLYYPESTIKIFCSAEPAFPNYNYCDYAIGTFNFHFEDRYFRFPYAFYHVPPEKLKKRVIDNNLSNRKFCNYIYWNTSYGEGPSIREEFCKKLMEYKMIDCPGLSLNNMKNALPGRYDKNWESGKIEFIKNYKFTIAFENAYYKGYVSEKLTHPFLAMSVPIYYGASDVDNDFNKNAFIDVSKFKSIDEVIDYIIYLDNNDEEYMKILSCNVLNENFNIEDFYRNFEEYIVSIVESKEKKVSIISKRFDPPTTLTIYYLNRIISMLSDNNNGKLTIKSTDILHILTGANNHSNTKDVSKLDYLLNHLLNSKYLQEQNYLYGHEINKYLQQNNTYYLFNNLIQSFDFSKIILNRPDIKKFINDEIPNGRLKFFFWVLQNGFCEYPDLINIRDKIYEIVLVLNNIKFNDASLIDYTMLIHNIWIIREDLHSVSPKTIFGQLAILTWFYRYGRNEYNLKGIV